MAQVVFPASQLLRGFGQIEKLLEQRRSELLDILAVRLLSMEQDSFRIKSRGGAGADGVTWKPLAASTIARKSRRGKRNEKRKTTKGGKARPGAGSTTIGVDTGLMRASAQPGFKGSSVQTGNSVTVGYSREYAGYFDEVRPLLPEVMPQDWADQLDDSTQRFLDNYVRGEIV